MEILVRIDDRAPLLDVAPPTLERLVMVARCTLRARLLHRFLCRGDAQVAERACTFFFASVGDK